MHGIEILCAKVEQLLNKLALGVYLEELIQVCPCVGRFVYILSFKSTNAT